MKFGPLFSYVFSHTKQISSFGFTFIHTKPLLQNETKFESNSKNQSVDALSVTSVTAGARSAVPSSGGTSGPFFRTFQAASRKICLGAVATTCSTACYSCVTVCDLKRCPQKKIEEYGGHVWGVPPSKNQK